MLPIDYRFVAKVSRGGRTSLTEPTLLLFALRVCTGKVAEVGNRKILVPVLILWLTGWNILFWVGNMRLRSGQTAIAIAKAHYGDLYQSGMREVIAGAQLERLAVIFGFGSLACALLVTAGLWFRRPAPGETPESVEHTPADRRPLLVASPEIERL